VFVLRYVKMCSVVFLIKAISSSAIFLSSPAFNGSIFYYRVTGLDGPVYCIVLLL
jgi:hypothetical protein